MPRKATTISIFLVNDYYSDDFFESFDVWKFALKKNPIANLIYILLEMIISWVVIRNTRVSFELCMPFITDLCVKLFKYIFESILDE